MRIDFLPADPAEIAAVVDVLKREDKETLQQVCGLIATCLGEDAPRKAVIIFSDCYTTTYVNINADIQEAYAMLASAHMAFKERVIGEIPERLN